MVVRTKRELAEILVSDSKLDNPEDHNLLVKKIENKSNEWFLRSFRKYDYRLIVLPGEKFKIR